MRMRIRKAAGERVRFVREMKVFDEKIYDIYKRTPHVEITERRGRKEEI